MPKVHFVKKARKDNPVAKKGEPYYWWRNYRGPVRYSRSRPNPSQTAGSEFLSRLYAVQEEMGDAKPETLEQLREMMDGWRSEINELRDDCQEKFDNMPEGFQQGEIGQLLESRADGLGEWLNTLESIELEKGDGETEAEAVTDRLVQINDNSPDVE